LTGGDNNAALTASKEFPALASAQLQGGLLLLPSGCYYCMGNNVMTRERARDEILKP
jgi:hypothetical protein